MAEGHSVVRWARALRPIVGETLVRVDVPKRWAERGARLQGQHVTRVRSHGKHLLLELSGSLTIHCHAMMYGSWQFGAPGMPLRKPERHVRLRLRTDRREAVFFNGPVTELLTPEELRAHERLNALGPDLLHADFDREEAWHRLGQEGARPIGDAILDQRLVAGVGNIFKSEGLFIAGIDPRARVGSLARGSVERLWDTLIPLMKANAARSGPIITLNRELRRGGVRHWVYRRRGEPCFRCAAPVRMERQGTLKRTTHFCSACQR